MLASHSHVKVRVPYRASWCSASSAGDSSRMASRMQRCFLGGRKHTTVAAASAESTDTASNGAPAARSFVNNGKFLVEKKAEGEFVQTWKNREANMNGTPGFASFSIEKLSDDAEGRGVVYATCSTWSSIPEFEEWNLKPENLRSHLPPGVWQWVQPLGMGFPEDFVPLVDTMEFPSAKYPPKPKKK